MINILQFVELISISLFPVSLVVSITLSTILLYVGLVCFGLQVFIFDKKRSSFDFSDTTQKAILIYVFCFTMSRLVNTGLSAVSGEILKALTVYFLYLWIKSFIRDNKTFSILQTSLLVASLVSIIYGLMQATGFDVFNRASGARLTGFHVNSFTYAGQLLIFFFFMLAMFLNTKKEQLKWFFLFLSATIFYLVISAGQRSVILGIAVALTLYILISIVKFKRKDSLYASLSFIFPFIITKYINQSMTNRMKKMFVINHGHNPRHELWDTAINLWKHNIFFGAGRFPELPVQGVKHTFWLSHAHSTYLQYLATDGLFGLLGYLSFILSVAYKSFMNAGKSIYSLSLFSVVIAFLIEGIFEFNFGDFEVRNLLIIYIAFVFSKYGD